MNSQAHNTVAQAERLPSQRVKDIYHALNRDSLHLLDELYAADATFIDPFHRIEGRAALHAYFAKMYANVSLIRFDFEDETATADELVLYWTMTYAHPRLNGGRPIAVPGCTRFRFVTDAASPDAGKVRLHRDYFDAGALLYEQIPLLGRVVRFLRERV